MQFDFSHLYHEKTVNITDGKRTVFQIVVGEIPSGASADIQNEAMSSVDMEKVTATTKRGRRKQMSKLVNQAMKEVNGAEMAIRDTLLGVKSWTLTDANGKAVPVCVDAYRGLPKLFANQIDAAVEELNEEIDEEFPDNGGNGDTDG